MSPKTSMSPETHARLETAIRLRQVVLEWHAGPEGEILEGQWITQATSPANPWLRTVLGGSVPGRFVTTRGLAHVFFDFPVDRKFAEVADVLSKELGQK